MRRSRAPGDDESPGRGHERADNTVGNTTNDPDGATDTTHSDSGYQGMTGALLKSKDDQATEAALCAASVPFSLAQPPLIAAITSIRERGSTAVSSPARSRST